jgi:hypothetical protein
MEKHLCKVAYWIGIICTVLALLTRGLAMLGIWTATLAGGAGSTGRIPLSYRSFLDGAVLFFLMAIASSVALWAEAQKS